MGRIIPLLVLLTAVLYVAIYGPSVKPKDVNSDGSISRVETSYTSGLNPNAASFVPGQPQHNQPAAGQRGPARTSDSNKDKTGSAVAASSSSSTPSTSKDASSDQLEFITEMAYTREKVDTPMILLALTWPETLTHSKDGKGYLKDNPEIDGLPNFRLLRVNWIDSQGRAPDWHWEREFHLPEGEERDIYKDNPHYTEPFRAIWPPRHLTVHGLWRDALDSRRKNPESDLKILKLGSSDGRQSGLSDTDFDLLRDEIWPDVKTFNPVTGPVGTFWASQIMGGNMEVPRWAAKQGGCVWRKEYSKHGYPMTKDVYLRGVIRNPLDYFRLVLHHWKELHLVALLRSRDPQRDNVPADDSKPALNREDGTVSRKGLYGMFRNGSGSGYDQPENGKTVKYGLLAEGLEPFTPGYAGSKGSLRDIHEAILHHLQQVTTGIDRAVLAKSFYTTCVFWNSDKDPARWQTASKKDTLEKLPNNVPKGFADSFKEALNPSAVYALYEVILCFDSRVEPQRLRLSRCRAVPQVALPQIPCPTDEEIYIP